VSTALGRLLEISHPDGYSVYLPPWFVRAIVPGIDLGTLIYMAGVVEPEVATESPEVIAQRLLDCQAPEDEEAPSP
jgi:hypothetical protein